MFVSLLVLVSLMTNYVWMAAQANKVEGEQSGKSGQVVLSFAYALALAQISAWPILPHRAQLPKSTGLLILFAKNSNAWLVASGI